MNKETVAKFFKNVRTSLAEHSPEILTGIGIAGMVTTTVLAVKATPKALQLIEQVKEELETDELTPIEVIKASWKCYIPAAITGIASTACLIGASRVSLRRNAALATAYKISETALTEYKAKVVETIGEKKEKTIREAIGQDHIDQHPVSKSEVIITKKGDTLFYDYTSGRYFKSDIEQIKKIINELNRQMLIHDYISLNDFYDEINMARIPLGDELGWRVIDGFIDVNFEAHMADDGTPCILLSYTVAPKRGYSMFA